MRLLRRRNFSFRFFILPALLSTIHFYSVNLYAAENSRVIYGEDNRRDLHEVYDSHFLKLADSSLALFQISRIKPDRIPGMVRINTSSYGKSYSLCEDEVFYDQPSGAYCSGSLIEKDLILTAGHCIRNQRSCEDTAFVFGFQLPKKDYDPTMLPSSEVYFCKNLVISRVDYTTGADFALVRLDREVSQHLPLELNRSGELRKGTPLVVIGHPAGLPTKVADGAKVRSTSPEGYFVANLDTFGGNSGSAVFNSETGRVEGILVRGEMDYRWRNGCRISNVCPDYGCAGEDVTRVSAVLPYLPEETVN